MRGVTPVCDIDAGSFWIGLALGVVLGVVLPRLLSLLVDLWIRFARRDAG